MNRDLLELLQGAGLEHIVLPRKDFIKEHRHLIKLLQKSDDPAFRKEASSQKKELDEMTGGNAKAGFIRRMMWENQHKHDGEYKRPVYPLADDSKMKQPWKFKYYKLANREQNGVNQRNYGASPFITRHFGNVRAEDEDESDDDDTIPPRPPLDDPRNESRRQRKARKLGFQRNEDYYDDEEGEEEPRSQKKARQEASSSSSSSSSTPSGAVLPEKKESDKEKAEKEVLENIRKRGISVPSDFKPLYELDKDWIALQKTQYPNWPKLDKVRKYKAEQFTKYNREKDRIVYRIIDEFYETERGIEALILQNELDTQGYDADEVKQIKKINDRLRREIHKAIKKEEGKPNKQPNRDIVRKVVKEDEEKRENEEEDEEEADEKQEAKRPARAPSPPPPEPKQTKASEPAVAGPRRTLPSVDTLKGWKKAKKEKRPAPSPIEIRNMIRGFSKEELLDFYRKEKQEGVRENLRLLATLTGVAHRRPPSQTSGAIKADGVAQNLVEGVLQPPPKKKGGKGKTSQTFL